MSFYLSHSLQAGFNREWSSPVILAWDSRCFSKVLCGRIHSTLFSPLWGRSLKVVFLLLILQIHVGHSKSPLPFPSCSALKHLDVGCTLHPAPFFLGGEVSVLHTFSLSHRAMPTIVNSSSFPFVLSFLQMFKLCAFPQHSKWGETEAGLLGSSSKVLVCWRHTPLFLPGGEVTGWGNLSQHWAVGTWGEGLMWA